MVGPTGAVSASTRNDCDRDGPVITMSDVRYIPSPTITSHRESAGRTYSAPTLFGGQVDVRLPQEPDGAHTMPVATAGVSGPTQRSD
jgi:hypothetical protein